MRGGNLHPPAAKKDPDLGDGQVVVQPALDALLFVEQRAPGLPVAVRSVRTDPIEHLTDQLLAQLLLPAGALDPELDGGGDVAPDRLSIDADPVGDRTFTLAAHQRRSASLTWTTDTSRNAMGPPRQRLWRPSRMSFRPALVDRQGGPITGKAGGPMSLAKPAINWSHVAGSARHRSDCGRSEMSGWSGARGSKHLAIQMREGAHLTGVIGDTLGPGLGDA